MNFIKVTQIIAVSIAFCSFSFGQVGVNTPNPNSSAALEVVSPSASDNRGVLLPRMTTAQMNTVATNSTTIGLMVFNTDDRLFYYYDGTKWIGLVPKQPITNLSNGSVNMEGNIILDTGSVIATNVDVVNANVSSSLSVGNNLNVNGFSQNALVPTGAIMMWSGDPNNIPLGWGLCNGNYYFTGGPIFGTPPPAPAFALPGFIQTPDLKGRFIVGYDPGASTTPVIAANNGTDINYGAIGNRGGEDGHQLVANELPNHNHTFTGSTSPNGNHTHGIQGSDGVGSGSDVRLKTGDVDTERTNQYTQGAGDHSHTFSGTTNNNVSSESVHENRPPYYVLAYIIKLP